jgi:hypothetical protein
MEAQSSRFYREAMQQAVWVYERADVRPERLPIAMYGTTHAATAYAQSTASLYPVVDGVKTDVCASVITSTIAPTLVEMYGYNREWSMRDDSFGH